MNVLNELKDKNSLCQNSSSSEFSKVDGDDTTLLS